MTIIVTVIKYEYRYIGTTKINAMHL